ncbi:uncharacterized protein LY89DRAFT_282035 [Mollisia scopiformis]|uniref:Uncharacterized protein n=1 Tax=Mollisia scopiformis TaxID=149040 RepID=A0A132BA37_MOLSC|nr:uncharacterized protein LY89DRAFT_282035 [Mollisia scopiformis]KUJ09270.1 hypothetical protein LY89DRAFT_282035 [Mollisia scopiformis]
MSDTQSHHPTESVDLRITVPNPYLLKICCPDARPRHVFTIDQLSQTGWKCRTCRFDLADRARQKLVCWQMDYGKAEGIKTSGGWWRHTDDILEEVEGVLQEKKRQTGLGDGGRTYARRVGGERGSSGSYEVNSCGGNLRRRQSITGARIELSIRANI